MAKAINIIDAIMSAPGIAALSSVRQAVAAAGGQPPPLALVAAAAGACPRFCFDGRELTEPSLAAFATGADVLAEVARRAGAQATWCTDAAAVARHLQDGGTAVIRTAEGWRTVAASTTQLPPLLPIPVKGFDGAVGLLIGRPDPSASAPGPDEVVRRIAQESLDRAADPGRSPVTCGPVAVDQLRRALSKAAQEGFGRWTAARGWLQWLVAELAGQMLLAAEALRYVAGQVADDRRLQMSMKAAAGNFDAAAAFAAGVLLVAAAGLEWPQRSAGEGAPDLDAAHWGTIYEMLRQASYHWRSAAGWLTRELVRLETQAARKRE